MSVPTSDEVRELADSAEAMVEVWADAGPLVNLEIDRRTAAALWLLADLLDAIGDRPLPNDDGKLWIWRNRIADILDPQDGER